MAGPRFDRKNALILGCIAVALFVAAFFSYSGHPVTESNLYSPHAGGWVWVVTSIVVGVLYSIIHIGDQRRNAKKRDNDAPPKT
jgi:hypothetical protein